jgi:glutathione S-transferase kappa 1
MRLELFFDIVSPYTYLAFTILERYREKWQLDLVMRPAFLGGVMKEVGNTPPAYLPQRAPYLVRDLGRLAKYIDVELQIPEDFPTNTLSTMRFITAVHLEKPEKVPDLARALWRHHWGKGKSIATPDGIAAGAGDVVDSAHFLARSQQQDVKDALKKVGDEAVERGVFGMPAMFVDVNGQNELFFGQDRIEVMASELGLDWHGPTP